MMEIYGWREYINLPISNKGIVAAKSGSYLSTRQSGEVPTLQGQRAADGSGSEGGKG
jgi:hypothetical protein